MIRMVATVDNVYLSFNRPSHLWKIRVTSPDHEAVGEYTLIADDENKAAAEGLRLYSVAFDPEPPLDV